MPHVVMFGAGAVGGYVCAHLVRAGETVTVVDPWPEHVEKIRADGLRVSGTQGEFSVKVDALHLADVQRLMRKPADIVIIALKSFDTEWAAQLIGQYLAPQGYVVSMQNGINEPRIAAAVGWGRTVGCALNTIGVSTLGPGHLARHRVPGGGGSAVFRLGELHGKKTARVEDLAKRLSAVDGSAVTENLWGERWAKLTTNAMQMGLLGATGLTNQELFDWEPTRKLMIRAAGEAVLVGAAQGYRIEPIIGVAGDVWVAAAEGGRDAVATVEQAFEAYLNRQTPEGRAGRGSLGRDVAAGRRSEIDFINGEIAAAGTQAGIATPVHSGLTAIVRQIERRERGQVRGNVLALYEAGTKVGGSER
jgi:2-dehydropantoate 2-reductase